MFFAFSVPRSIPVNRQWHSDRTMGHGPMHSTSARPNHTSPMISTNLPELYHQLQELGDFHVMDRQDTIELRFAATVIPRPWTTWSATLCSWTRSNAMRTSAAAFWNWASAANCADHPICGCCVQEVQPVTHADRSQNEHVYHEEPSRTHSAQQQGRDRLS